MCSPSADEVTYGRRRPCHIELELVRTLEAPETLHLRYEVVEP
jgi:hypothetical protein